MIAKYGLELSVIGDAEYYVGCLRDDRYVRAT